MSTTSSVAIAPINWEALPGAAIQIGSSFDTLWALNNENKLFQCKLPCDEYTNTWSIIPETNFQSFSVNPFEIWAVSHDNSLYRCKFPCNSLKDFQMVTQGVHKVALGLDRVWLISKDYRVGRTLLNFEGLGRFMDVRILNWKQLYGDVKAISIGEDSEVWGIRKSDRQLLRYHRPSRQWLQVANIKARRVSVGSDFIYITDLEGNAQRCSRPCWQINFVSLGKKMSSLSAEMSGPGVLYGVLNMDSKMSNLVVGFAVGNRTGFESVNDSQHHEFTPYTPYQIPEWMAYQPNSLQQWQLPQQPPVPNGHTARR